MLPDVKGLRDLAALLAGPGREVHCTELAGTAVEQPDTGEVLDTQAPRRYEARIVALQGELTEAENAHDRGAPKLLAWNSTCWSEQLAVATGLGGRSRRAGGTAERATSRCGPVADSTRLSKNDPGTGIAGSGRPPGTDRPAAGASAAARQAASRGGSGRLSARR